jgi:mono/diheme cytochrome c family protein
MAGRYQLTARTLSKAQKPVELKIEEIALGYQQELGFQLDNKYCARCHNPESTPERVSNYDNLEVKPHPFTEGDTLNKMSDAELTAIISHGGPALSKSALMPPYGYTLSKTEIEALIAYIRLISDPPYHASGIVYAQK